MRRYSNSEIWKLVENDKIEKGTVIEDQDDN